MLILPHTNNTIATVCDAVMVFLLLWAVSSAAGWTMSFADLLLAAVLAGIFEYFFHFWLLHDHASVKRQKV